MNIVLILILAVAVAAAAFFALRRRSGQTGAGGNSPEPNFVEAANAASKAARQSVASTLGGPLGGR